MKAPKTETELLENALRLSGLTFTQLASRLQIPIPTEPLYRKGWIGMAIEKILGADAKNESIPDFKKLGIELKTIPMSKSGNPVESTFVSSIPLLTIHRQTWKTSSCYAKLQRVLWIPIEGDTDIIFSHRRIGHPILWSPDETQASVLEEDWNDLTFKIIEGCLDSINAGMGTFLQIRPKASNSKALCDAYDAEGNRMKTLPRGFYLRSTFTSLILNPKST